MSGKTCMYGNPNCATPVQHIQSYFLSPLAESQAAEPPITVFSYLKRTPLFPADWGGGHVVCKKIR